MAKVRELCFESNLLQGPSKKEAKVYDKRTYGSDTSFIIIFRRLVSNRFFIKRFYLY